jgi:hypothetical protein
MFHRSSPALSFPCRIAGDLRLPRVPLRGRGARRTAAKANRTRIHGGRCRLNCGCPGQREASTPARRQTAVAAIMKHHTPQNRAKQEFYESELRCASQPGDSLAGAHQTTIFDPLSLIPDLRSLVSFFHPPAIAPRISSGSLPVATASGRGLSGDSSDQSSWHTKKRRNARRWPVP